MADTQYELFRDLDRHCVARGVVEHDCLEAVRRKRACIASELNRANPLVRDVLEGRATFTAVYDSYSRGFRGIRRFLPMAYDEAYNVRLEQLGKIIPNVRHFLRRSVLATDNPFTCALYGIVASSAIALVWSHVVKGDDGSGDLDSAIVFALALGLGFAGFLAGLFAAMKNRTRTPRSIHAREAAEYMDLNYNCHRMFDDEAWAKLIALKTTPPGTSVEPAPSVACETPLTAPRAKSTPATHPQAG